MPPATLRRLYVADASGIRDEALIDEVGITLLARCESIHRVTERRCPSCGSQLDGAFDGDGRQRIVSCDDCGFSATWAAYHLSYKRNRLHGGRAYPAYLAYLRDYPGCRTPAEKMMCIDRLIHALHQSLDHGWTRPAADNLIAAKRLEVLGLLTELAGVERSTIEGEENVERFVRAIEQSDEATPALREEMDRAAARRGHSRPGD